MKIVFLGPDGVGKSTVINQFRSKLDKLNLSSSYHYLVPGYLPRYKNVKNGIPVTDPHAGKEHGVIKSIIKLLYWAVEYILGIKKMDKNDSYMLFDRYYYDILVDPKRYCYGAPNVFSRIIARIIPKPTLLIILDAPTEVIQSRKQEVLPDETERQRQKYLALNGKYCKTIVLDTQNDIKNNIEKIFFELQEL